MCLKFGEMHSLDDLIFVSDINYNKFYLILKSNFSYTFIRFILFDCDKLRF